MQELLDLYLNPIKSESEKIKSDIDNFLSAQNSKLNLAYALLEKFNPIIDSFNRKWNFTYPEFIKDLDPIEYHFWSKKSVSEIIQIYLNLSKYLDSKLNSIKNEQTK